ncbi:MAG: 50S ribosomal protein L16 [Candidatus Yanofskybacteria bacterium RIFCSPHIGHO2_02_FULL_44_12b]|uniref:Large ribosomal subunit protein uL16 n=2 Tax=Candidatus Yanofskyibacteriota TaxID=1752733 RepID=A0A1F8GJG1_9BACT|nr:MAG: 50S ribosomal protein L16 [Candidatus Yanofskybacteria bacterium GW2011_GWA2_44_9]OGN04823.1 MAG: 50S ribosomal protein L16 [Candidatus Yanofskybacteria bacterium RIFCSPHIGHO2_01_FULL_44_24]OGN16069.1 MAG: 50S ribosomal protein L16 [Candidatus Yanofskybacteria bacterium RIFCSPHIGHO2_02_FULL_44_12b]OGN25140.1 MAG: 50S ribosomal protein L16 [Candidatus Yanofskybacteria bacterium RIFCSPLOWO2_01_FULL_44_22]
MLQPARIQHPKVHRGKLKARATRGVELSFGTFGLKAGESSWVKANQLESARKVMARFVQRGGKIWTRVFPDKPRTAKSAEVGMGGGKGGLSHFIVPVEAGKIIFEIDGVSEADAKEALRLGSHKLPLKTRIVKR